MECQAQQLICRKKASTNYSTNFPIAPLSSTLSVPRTKGIGNTSSDSGVNSPPAFSTTTLSIQFNHSPRRPTLTPSTSHMITSQKPRSQLLTPIQRLIHHNTVMYQNKEPKNNRSQPDKPEPESVLRTRPRQAYKF